MRQVKFEVIITYDEDRDQLPTEGDLDLGALHYGDKHQDYTLHAVPGTIKEYS